MKIQKLIIEALLVGIDGENLNVEVYVDGEEVAVMKTTTIELVDPMAAARTSALEQFLREPEPEPEPATDQRVLPWSPISTVPIEDDPAPVDQCLPDPHALFGMGSFKADPDLPNFHNPMHKRPRRHRGGEDSPIEYYFQTEQYGRLAGFLNIGTRPAGCDGVWLTQLERVKLNDYKVEHPTGTPTGRQERTRPGRGSEPATVTEYRFNRSYKRHAKVLGVGSHERRGVPFVWLTKGDLEVIRDYLRELKSKKVEAAGGGS